MRRALPVLLLLAACGGGEETVPSEEAGAPPAPMAQTRPAPGVHPFQGLWAGEGTNCALSPGTAPEAPVEITAERFTGYENACDLQSVRVLEANVRFRVGMRCEGEGMPYEREVTYTLSPDALLAEEGTRSAVFTRCDPDEAAG